MPGQRDIETPGIRGQVFQAAAVASRVGRITGSPVGKPGLDIVPMIFSDMEKRHPSRAEQMLVSVTNQIVDVRQPGLDRYERNGVGGVDKQLCPVMTCRGHNIIQGSGFSVLRPCQAERDEMSLRPNPCGELAEGQASQVDAPLLLGHQYRKENRGELLVRNDHLYTYRQ